MTRLFAATAIATALAFAPHAIAQTTGAGQGSGTTQTPTTGTGSGTAAPAPGTQAPGTEAPSTQVPSSQAPGTQPPGTQAPGGMGAASEPAVPASREKSTAEFLLDRIETVLNAALGNDAPHEGPAPAAGAEAPKAVGTSGEKPEPKMKTDKNSRRVSIDRATLEEMRAEVEQLKTLIRR